MAYVQGKYEKLYWTGFGLEGKYGINDSTLMIHEKFMRLDLDSIFGVQKSLDLTKSNLNLYSYN